MNTPYKFSNYAASAMLAVGLLGLTSLAGCAGTAPINGLQTANAADKSSARTLPHCDDVTVIERIRASHVDTIITQEDLLRTGHVSLGPAINKAARTIPASQLGKPSVCREN